MRPGVESMNRRRWIALAAAAVVVVIVVGGVVAWRSSQSGGPSCSPITLDAVHDAASRLGRVHLAGHPKSVDYDVPPDAPRLAAEMLAFEREHLSGLVTVGTDEWAATFVVFDSPASAQRFRNMTSKTTPAGLSAALHEN